MARAPVVALAFSTVALLQYKPMTIERFTFLLPCLLVGCVENARVCHDSPPCDQNAQLAQQIGSEPNCGTYSVNNNVVSDPNKAAQCADDAFRANTPFVVTYAYLTTTSTSTLQTNTVYVSNPPAAISTVLTEAGTDPNGTAYTRAAVESCNTPYVITNFNHDPIVQCTTQGAVTVLCDSRPVCTGGD